MYFGAQMVSCKSTSSLATGMLLRARYGVSLHSSAAQRTTGVPVFLNRPHGPKRHEKRGRHRARLRTVRVVRAALRVGGKRRTARVAFKVIVESRSRPFRERHGGGQGLGRARLVVLLAQQGPMHVRRLVGHLLAIQGTRGMASGNVHGLRSRLARRRPEEREARLHGRVCARTCTRTAWLGCTRFSWPKKYLV